MTTEQARSVIANPMEHDYAEQCEAAAHLACSGTIPDLLACLRVGGMPAETAALALYRRSGRERGDGVDDFVTDPADWARYMRLPEDQPRSILTNERGFQLRE